MRNFLWKSAITLHGSMKSKINNQINAENEVELEAAELEKVEHKVEGESKNCKRLC